MRALLINVTCKRGSTGKIAYDLYQNLQADGHEVGICYGRGKKIKEKNIYKFGLDLETYIHAGLARLTGFNGCFSYFSTRRLIRFIKKFKPDVVHLHELHGYYVNYKTLIRFLQKLNVKIVYTFHCEYAYTGKCGHAYECPKWQTTCEKCSAKNEYPKSLFFDQTKKMHNTKKELLTNLDFTIVTPSKWLADRVRTSFLKDKEIRVIHNGIDTEHTFYLRDEEQTKALKERVNVSNKKIVLSVAPKIMSESKGGGKVLEISKAFAKENVHFVLIGAERDEKPSDNVTVIKSTANQDELALWYSSADVFLICSKRENFPTTCLEALCCGTPIVGIDEGGTKETAPAPYGAFFKAEDEQGLINAIREKMELKEKSAEISRLGKELYSKDVMYKKYCELYFK